MPDVELEIGHVLFVDIVGYTKLLIHEQLEYLEKLRDIARATETFRAAQREGKLMRLPTGDGGALVFHKRPEEPVKCALEIARELKKNPSCGADGDSQRAGERSYRPERAREHCRRRNQHRPTRDGLRRRGSHSGVETGRG
jgi:hypothetical protein